VKSVENLLEAHEQAGDIPDLQGGRVRPGEKFAFFQANWSPTARLLAGAAGGALVVYGAKRQKALGAVTGAVGLGLLSRALTNIEVAQLIGVGSHPRGIQIQKTINIAAGVEQVFDFWTRHEEFPRFMSNVHEVKKTGENRYHWTVAGPLGVSVEWDAEITKQIPNTLLAWKSLDGSAIEQTGIIHFTPTTEGDTCVDISLSYNPPAGAIGHLIAMLFGADPKSEMDADLMRMKSFIETGRVPHDAAKKEQLAHSASGQ
jgi:uncharacterized membrane protein